MKFTLVDLLDMNGGCLMLLSFFGTVAKWDESGRLLNLMSFSEEEVKVFPVEEDTAVHFCEGNPFAGILSLRIDDTDTYHNQV